MNHRGIVEIASPGSADGSTLLAEAMAWERPHPAAAGFPTQRERQAFPLSQRERVRVRASSSHTIDILRSPVTQD
jgi:hypothetical protein